MKKLIYISGSVEYSNDLHSWRNTMKKALSPKFNVIIPYLGKIPYKKNDKHYENGYPRYQKWVYEHIFLPDIQNVFMCDYFFVNIDKNTLKGSGTFGELTLAKAFKKPIVVFLNGVEENELPSWTLGCLYETVHVNSIEEAIKHYSSPIL